MAVNSDQTGTPNGAYELKDAIALRNSTRCGTTSGGTSGTQARPTLSFSVPPGDDREHDDARFLDRRDSHRQQQPVVPDHDLPDDRAVGLRAVDLQRRQLDDRRHRVRVARTATSTRAAAASARARPPATTGGMPRSRPTRTTRRRTPLAHRLSRRSSRPPRRRPTLSVSAPAMATTGIAIPASSISATISGSLGASGPITIYAYLSATNPATCPGVPAGRPSER